LNKGADAPHLHTFAYHIVVIEGQVAHKTESIPGSEEIVLGPGSYWYQVANVVHQDICLSDKALVYYVQHGDGDTVWS
jgi:quercetin dioxygenase-like cupin family protein